MRHNPEFLSLIEQAKKRIKEFTAAHIKEKLNQGEEFHFIDVREDHEFCIDYVEGARHLGKGVIECDIETLIPEKNEPIILYCGGRYRLILEADALQQMGYTNVASMVGGVKSWDAGFLLKKGDCD